MSTDIDNFGNIYVARELADEDKSDTFTGVQAYLAEQILSGWREDTVRKFISHSIFCSMYYT